MLIIFDLDDTLIETSSCVIPRKLRDALEALSRAGLEVENFALDYQQLLLWNSLSESGVTAIEKFLFAKEAYAPELLEAGKHAYYGPLPEDMDIECVPGALPTLRHLFGKHLMALVTGGKHPHLQSAKMKKAGIDPSFFSNIVFATDGNKRGHYEVLLREHAVAPEDTVVCGDRPALDLVPAKELGCTTVRMLRGRGKLVEGGRVWGSEVDIAVGDLWEFRAYIERRELIK